MIKRSVKRKKYLIPIIPNVFGILTFLHKAFEKKLSGKKTIITSLFIKLAINFAVLRSKLSENHHR